MPFMAGDLAFMTSLRQVYSRLSFCKFSWSIRYCRLKLICISCICCVADISSAEEELWELCIPDWISEASGFSDSHTDESHRAHRA